MFITFCILKQLATLQFMSCFNLLLYVSDIFVVTEQNLGQVLTGLMEGLYQVLGAIKSFDTKVHDQQKSN